MLLLVFQILQVLSGALLVVLILLHSPKGAGLGGIGGAAQLFSSQSSAEAGLNKLTHSVAFTFILISILIGLGIIH
jgi:preprotein translocase subunit SecG